jgi:hypothetical protein
MDSVKPPLGDLFKDLYALRKHKNLIADRKVIDEFFISMKNCSAFCQGMFSKVLTPLCFKVEGVVGFQERHETFVSAINKIIAYRNLALAKWLNKKQVSKSQNQAIQFHQVPDFSISNDGTVGLCNLVMLLDLFICAVFRSSYIPFIAHQVFSQENAGIKKTFSAEPTINKCYSDINKKKSAKRVQQSKNVLGLFAKNYSTKDWNKDSMIGKFVAFLSPFSKGDFAEKDVLDGLKKIHTFMRANTSYELKIYDAWNESEDIQVNIPKI